MFLATFALPHAAIALEETLSELPRLTVEAERIAAHSTAWTMPCLWIGSDDFDRVDAALGVDPSVRSIVDSHDYGTERFYHLEWSPDVIELIDSYTDKEGSMLSLRTLNQGWEAEFRFVSRDQLTTFRETLREAGHSFRLLDLREPGTPHGEPSGITPKQREALLTALNLGYFEVPRGISIRGLADELGISHQSVSELLRRGNGKLVASSLRTQRPSTTVGYRG